MLTKLEEKRMLAKITNAVGKLIVKANYKWTDREIAESAHVPPNRLTEYKNFEKYQRNISVNHLAKLLGGGFFTVDDIIKNTPELTDEEKKHLKDLNYYEDKELRRKIIKNKQLGIDQIELQSLVHELVESGIDPMAILKSAKKET